MTATITLGGQMGDVNAEQTVGSQIGKLANFLEQCCKGPYSPEVNEFALIFRVDGDLWHWNKEGCERLRRSFKEKYITIDLMVPQSKWYDKSTKEIRTYLMNLVEEALNVCLQRLEKDKVNVETEKLHSDLQSVRKKFVV